MITITNLRLRTLVFVVFAAIMSMLSSCGTKPDTTQKDLRAQAIKRIDSLQTQLRNAGDGPGQTQTALRLAEAYQFFALDYRDDSLSLPFILKEANIYSTLGDFMKAANLDKYAYDTYPNHPMRPNALFFLGNALHDAGDSAQCVVVFEKFVKEYPNHPYREGAAQMADFMKKGKGSLEEFIERRAKQVADSLANAKKIAQ